MLKRILVALSGTGYTRAAIAHAVDIAMRHNACVTGVTVVDIRQLERARVLPMAANYRAQVLREHRITVAQEHVASAAEDFAHACQAAGVSHQVLQEAGDVFELLIAHSKYHDLTILGLRSPFEHEIAGKPCDALVRLISGGVRPILAVAHEYRNVGRVMIAYSGSMESAKAMKRFVQLRLWPDARLKIVTFNSADAEAKRLAYDAADYCRAHGYPVDWQTNPGVAKNLLLAAAKLWQADMIVMGNSGRSVLLSNVFGATAKSMIQDSDRPLFLCQ